MGGGSQNLQIHVKLKRVINYHGFTCQLQKTRYNHPFSDSGNWKSEVGKVPRLVSDVITFLSALCCRSCCWLHPWPDSRGNERATSNLRAYILLVLAWVPRKTSGPVFIGVRFGEAGEERGAINQERGKEQVQRGGEPSESLHKLLYLRTSYVGGTEKHLSISNFLVPVLPLTRVVSMGLNFPFLPTLFPGFFRQFRGKLQPPQDKEGPGDRLGNLSVPGSTAVWVLHLQRQ